eukprot:jgi/Botrbrau1/4287/Bobra.0390s0027.1
MIMYVKEFVDLVFSTGRMTSVVREHLFLALGGPICLRFTFPVSDGIAVSTSNLMTSLQVNVAVCSKAVCHTASHVCQGVVEERVDSSGNLRFCQGHSEVLATEAMEIWIPLPANKEIEPPGSDGATGYVKNAEALGLLSISWDDTRKKLRATTAAQELAQQLSKELSPHISEWLESIRTGFLPFLCMTPQPIPGTCREHACVARDDNRDGGSNLPACGSTSQDCSTTCSTKPDAACPTPPAGLLDNSLRRDPSFADLLHGDACSLPRSSSGCSSGASCPTSSPSQSGGSARLLRAAAGSDSVAQGDTRCLSRGSVPCQGPSLTPHPAGSEAERSSSFLIARVIKSGNPTAASVESQPSAAPLCLPVEALSVPAAGYTSSKPSPIRPSKASLKTAKGADLLPRQVHDLRLSTGDWHSDSKSRCTSRHAVRRSSLAECARLAVLGPPRPLMRRLKTTKAVPWLEELLGVVFAAGAASEEGGMVMMYVWLLSAFLVAHLRLLSAALAVIPATPSEEHARRHLPPIYQDGGLLRSLKSCVGFRC